MCHGYSGETGDVICSNYHVSKVHNTMVEGGEITVPQGPGRYKECVANRLGEWRDGSYTAVYPRPSV